MIRGILIVLFGVLLFGSLLAVNASWDLSSSLKYDNVQSHAINVFNDVINQQINLTQEIENRIQSIRDYCQTGSDFVFSSQGNVFRVSCNNINQSVAELVNSTIVSFIGDLYYKDYGCSFWNCLNNQTNSTFLISQQTEDYWNKVFYISLAIAFLSIVFLFLLFEKKQNMSFFVGSIIILTSLPLLGVQKIVSGLPNAFSNILSIFLSQTDYVFIRMVTIGVAIFCIGLIINLIEVGFKLYDFFSERKETIVKNGNNRRKKF